jgi:hypothetical protein
MESSLRRNPFIRIANLIKQNVDGAWPGLPFIKNFPPFTLLFLDPIRHFVFVILISSSTSQLACI